MSQENEAVMPGQEGSAVALEDVRSESVVEDRETEIESVPVLETEVKIESAPVSETEAKIESAPVFEVRDEVPRSDIKEKTDKESQKNDSFRTQNIEKTAAFKTSGDIFAANKQEIVTFLVAIVLLIALFLPTVSIGTTYSENNSYSVTYSPFEFCKSYIDAVIAYFNPSLDSTDVYRDYAELKSRVERLSIGESQLALLSEYAKSAITFYMAENGIVIKLSAILSILFFACSAVSIVMLVVVSLLVLVLSLLSYGNKFKHKMSNFGKKLCILSLSLGFVSTLTLMHAVHFTSNVPINNFGDLGVKIGFGGVLSLLIYSTVFLQMVVTCVRREYSPTNLDPLAKGIALVAVLLAAISVFFPTAVIKFAAPVDSSVEIARYSIDSQDVCEIDKFDAEYYVTQAGSMTEQEFIDMASAIATGAKSKSHALKLFHIAAFSSGNVAGFYNALTVLRILLLVFAIMLIKNIAGVIFDKKTGTYQNLWLTLFAISSFIYLLLNIILPFTCYRNVSYNMAFYVDFSVGFGPIMIIICAVISMVALTMRKTTAMKLEFDNPDVSVTKYVFDKNNAR